MRRLLLAAVAASSLAAALGWPAGAAAAEPVSVPKVAIIVGPVGSLTPTYLALAERAAATAEAAGAIVARAYSPNATPANVLAAVEGAHVVIYFGHGYGHPSPYGPLDTGRQNGWGLQGPGAHGTHGDAIGSELAYYGEDWIVANARPAPGFVMIYSNTCYAPGASEGGFAPATERVAVERVANYSRATFAMGGSAYYAIDFDRGAADLVGRILANRQSGYGTLFASDPRYVPSALRTYVHPFGGGREIWVHRTKYTDGPPNYWYAFAGNPAAVPARSWDSTPPTASLATATTGVLPGAPLLVEFSEPVHAVGAATLLLTDATGAAVDAGVEVLEGGRAARVTPTTPLSYSARYGLRIAAGIVDGAGHPLAPSSWTIATRLDADPLVGPVQVWLARGSHELVRVGPDGAVTERRSLALPTPRAVSATERARLPGSSGSWLRLVGTDVDGWWVAESGAAHVPGVVESVALPAGRSVTLRAGVHPVRTLGPVGMLADGEVRVRTERLVEIDRVAVVDGLLRVRAAATAAELAGRWLTAPAGGADVRAGVGRRSLVAEEGVPSTVSLLGGEWTLFRFDATGVVAERRTVPAAELEQVVSGRRLDVAGAAFLEVTAGPYAGWAVRESDAVVVRGGQARGDEAS